MLRHFLVGLEKIKAEYELSNFCDVSKEVRSSSDWDQSIDGEKMRKVARQFHRLL